MNQFEFDKPYDRDKFLDFMIDFLPDDFTPRIEPLALTDFTPKCARQATRLGVSEILQLEVLEIVHSSSRDARVAIAQDAFKLLLHKSYKNRALVIFRQENSAQYRLSLLQIEAVQSDLSSRIRRSYSNPRRYSFLLGEGAHVKTPYQFLVRNGKLKPVDGDYFKDLQNRFSVETLTKLFYKELSDWYFWAIKTVSFPNNINNPADNRKYNPENVIRLITRLIFVWFLKQKNLVEPFLFDEKELAAILRDFDPLSNTQTNYYRAILQNLFFATLNREINQREFAKDEGYLKNRSNYNVKNQYRYENDFIDKDTDHIMELFAHIPFLNGGLFECLDDRKIEDDIFCWDGFSRREDRQAFVPNRLFFAKSETVDLSSEYNNAKMKAVNVSGILEILNRYNFTIEENTPAEIEVALDPELLGRVFENLLGSFNPETQDTARKQTGSFYTPRDIVTYMVNESLVAYYTNQVKDASEGCLRNILGYEDIDFDLSETQRKALIKATYSCRIIDPACGSGAFPMGMLQQLVHVLRKLDPQNNYWHDIVLEETSKALQQAGNDDDKSEQLDEIARVFDSAIHYPDYARKLYLIANCIYGVDLQSIAVQISKLRFFISLICEQDSTDDAGNNYGIRPLPNLDTKFVAANTLIAIDKNEEDMKYMADSRIKKLLDELDRVRKRQFSASNAGQKKNYREKDERLREAILREVERLSIEHAKRNLLAENQQELEKKQTELDQLLLTPDIIDTVTQTDLFGPKHTTQVNQTAIRIKELQTDIARIEEAVKKASDYSLQNPAVRLAKQLTSWNPYDQNTHADWFDPEWMFGIRDGFDIVIGNPPYVSTKGVSESDKKILEKQFGFADDLYTHFYFKGMDLLKDKGVLSFITSKTFWTIQTKKNLRTLILKNKLLQLFDTANPFAAVMVDTCVILIQKVQDLSDEYLFTYLDGTKDLSKPNLQTGNIIYYRNSPNQVFFPINELNLRIYERYGKKVNELLNTWWNKISTSKNIEKNKKELEKYRTSLKPGDITLLGLITEGGQGLATANNGKYIGVLEGTKWAENIKKQRPEKLLLAGKFCRENQISNKSDAVRFLDSLDESEIRNLFDELKENYGRDIFGQGWLYRIVSPAEIADVNSLTDDEKLNGIVGDRTFVPYDKGDKDGNRWFAPTPYYIDWSRKNVKFLKENSGKKGEGMPVVRNPQFYFREGFCWTDVNSTYLKSRIKENGVYDVLTMSLFTTTYLPDLLFVCFINSSFISKYVDIFINSTSHFQINDARQLPIIIPNAAQLQFFENIFNRAVAIQKDKFSEKMSELIAEKELDKIQRELDKFVEEMYLK